MKRCARCEKAAAKATMQRRQIRELQAALVRRNLTIMELRAEIDRPAAMLYPPVLPYPGPSLFSSEEATQ